MTISSADVVRDWHQYMTATGASPATVRVRLHVITALTRHAGLVDPLQLNRRHVLAFLARDIKQWSRVTYWRAIRSWCAWLVEFEYPHDDLLRGIPKPRIPSAIARPIDAADITSLLEARITKRARAYVILALYGGLRVHEIAGLKAENMDLESGWMTITGKGGITKPIPIHPEILKLAAVMPEMGYWFPAPADLRGHVTAAAVSQTVANALRSIGCAASAHRLRDTAATNFQRQVKDIRMTQALLRHQSLQSSMKYCAVSDSALQAAVRAMTYAS